MFCDTKLITYFQCKCHFVNGPLFAYCRGAKILGDWILYGSTQHLWVFSSDIDSCRLTGTSNLRCLLDFWRIFPFLAYSVSQVVNITAHCRWKLRTALFWVITQWVVVISHRCFRTVLSVLSSRVSLEDGTYRLSWNIGKELLLYTGRNISEECSSQPLYSGSLKSHTGES